MNRIWWKEAVVYQIYPKSFCDMNGDGYGDIKGIISKLSYIADLGVNAIWLTPFFKSPMIDNGYDISDYLEVESIFGDKADIIELVNTAKDLGIKIIIDLVINHTSSEHSWFKNALKSKDSPYRDYYIFRETDNGLPPNNWRSIFGGSAWEKVDDSVFYLHTFDKKQPDLNWENATLRQEIYQVIKHWMDLGVQGFRMDAITFIKKPHLFIAGPEDHADGLRDIAKDSLDQPGIHAFLQEMKSATYGKSKYMTIAEAPGIKYEGLKTYVGETGAFSMIFDFMYTDLDLQENSSWYPQRKWTIEEYRDKIFKSQMAYQKVGWVGLFNENHDQPRSIDKFFGSEDNGQQDYLKATTLATMYFFMRGTPFIYQGQELGIRNHKFETIDMVNDVATVEQYGRALSVGASEEEAMKVVNQRSRDHSRTPMLWSDDKNAGFTNSVPWLPINKNYRIINADIQSKQTFSVYKYYKKMIEVRKHEDECLIYGQFEPILEIDVRIIAYKRISENGDRIIVLSNLSKDSITFNLDLTDCEFIMGNYADSEISAVYYEGELRPLESVVLKQKSI